MIHDGHLPSKHPSCSVRNSERQRRINSQLHCRKLAQRGEKMLNPLPPLLDGMVSVCGDTSCRIKCCKTRGTPELSLAGPLRNLSWSSWSRRSLALGRTPVRSTKQFQHNVSSWLVARFAIVANFLQIILKLKYCLEGSLLWQKKLKEPFFLEKTTCNCWEGFFSQKRWSSVKFLLSCLSEPVSASLSE